VKKEEDEQKAPPQFGTSMFKRKEEVSKMRILPRPQPIDTNKPAPHGDSLGCIIDEIQKHFKTP
jgi:hypothetical protein